MGRPKKMVEEAIEHVVEKDVEQPTKTVKKAVKLDDSVLVSVKSTAYGELIYVNSRTGDKTKWSNYGDIQVLSIGDLRAMKGTQRSFFSNRWIEIVGIEESGYEDVTVEDICKTLLVTQYYNDVLYPTNLYDILSWSVNDIKEKVPKMSEGTKMSIVVLANESIENGELDSVKRIQAIEDVLGCQLNRQQ